MRFCRKIVFLTFEVKFQFDLCFKSFGQFQTTFFGINYSAIGVFALRFDSGYAANGVNYTEKKVLKNQPLMSTTYNFFAAVIYECS
jgi:hypothetical protein